MLGQALTLINGPTIATAIAQSNNSITQLVAEEKDDNRLVDELFVRILSRAATQNEIEAGVKALHATEVEGYARALAEAPVAKPTLDAFERQTARAKRQLDSRDAQLAGHDTPTD